MHLHIILDQILEQRENYPALVKDVQSDQALIFLGDRLDLGLEQVQIHAGQKNPASAGFADCLDVFGGEKGQIGKGYSFYINELFEFIKKGFDLGLGV